VPLRQGRKKYALRVTTKWQDRVMKRRQVEEKGIQHIPPEVSQISHSLGKGGKEAASPAEVLEIRPDLGWVMRNQ
jgi:hypothetical protein